MNIDILITTNRNRKGLTPSNIEFCVRKTEPESITDSRLDLEGIRVFAGNKVIEYRRNEREGSGFLSFLPEKREGNIFRWSFRLNYQLNPFITGGFEYSGNKYPLQDTVHQLKVEARAEF